MKKYFTLLAFVLIGSFILSSCSDDEDFDTYSVAYEHSTNFSSTNNYSTFFVFPNNLNIQSSDMVLVYRHKRETSSIQNPIWEMIPRTIYLSSGDEFDYDFDFTIDDVNIYMDATDFGAIPAGDYLNGQTFRILVIPASYGNKMDYSDYNTVIQHFGIDDSKVIKL